MLADPRTAISILALVVSLALVPSVRAAAGGAVAPEAAGAPAAAVAGSDQPPAAVVAPARAGRSPATIEGAEVLVSAEHLERSNEESTVIGEGAVTIRYRDMRLVADRVVYNERTREVVADGNVVLDSGADRLQGRHLELNLETRIGFLEHAQGFVQTYYLTGERIEKRGPDRYFIRGGSFTTCEGVWPDWSFHTTSTDVTIDEYLHAWNPTLQIKSLPILYFPYAVFPIKRDRSTGLLIPLISISGTNGFSVRNAFYWAPRDNFDATVGLDYLQQTGWGASGETRYLLAPRTQGVISAYYLRNTTIDAQSWLVSTRNSHELPLGIHAEIEAFFQSDREFLSTQGRTIEERSSERTTSSFFINRNWSAWSFALSGRNEVSLITESRTTLTRFPELTIDRTGTRLFGTDLFLKLAASGAVLKRDDAAATLSTTRLHIAPEMTWPLSLGSVARVIPSAGYALTNYSENKLGVEETRAVPFFKLGLEGPRPYRIWDLEEGGRFTRLKHLVEPSISYVYIPDVNQDNLPLFDSLDRIAQANRVEYSLTNTLYAKMRAAQAPAPRRGAVSPAPGDSAAIGGGDESAPPRVQPTATRELLWVKLSQNYTLADDMTAVAGQPFSTIELEARTRPLTGLEVQLRGNYDVYDTGIGYHNLSLSWNVSDRSSLQADWRSTRNSDQDFLDLGANFSLGLIDVQARSRYNLAESTFVENRVSIRYVSQCWDVTLGYVRWATEYEYSLAFALKGIGTILKI